MTKAETCEVLNLLKAAYPLFYSNARGEAMERVITLWHEVFGKYEFGQTKRAVNRMIVSETQIPTIALVKAYILKQTELDKLERKRADAWKEAGCASEEEFREKIAELRR